MLSKKKIYTAIPTFGGHLVPGLVRNLIFWSHNKNYTMGMPPDIREGLFPLDNARNTIIKDFLETDADYLWWIDDDIIPTPDALDRMAGLLDSREDIDAIGAACFSMKRDNGKYFPYPVTLRLNQDQRYQVYYGKGVEQVDATGGACVMVKRKVYEALVRPYEFYYHRDGTLALTCDFVVWQRAIAAGFKLWVDFDLLCDHQRTCSIKGFQDFLTSIG